MAEADESFHEYVRARMAVWLRVAFLLSGMHTWPTSWSSRR